MAAIELDDVDTEYTDVSLEADDDVIECESCGSDATHIFDEHGLKYRVCRPCFTKFSAEHPGV